MQIPRQYKCSLILLRDVFITMMIKGDNVCESTKHIVGVKCLLDVSLKGAWAASHGDSPLRSCREWLVQFTDFPRWYFLLELHWLSVLYPWLSVLYWAHDLMGVCLCVCMYVRVHAHTLGCKVSLNDGTVSACLWQPSHFWPSWHHWASGHRGSIFHPCST